jgi:hypothetical protein
MEPPPKCFSRPTIPFTISVPAFRSHSLASSPWRLSADQCVGRVPKVVHFFAKNFRGSGAHPRAPHACVPMRPQRVSCRTYSLTAAIRGGHINPCQP